MFRILRSMFWVSHFEYLFGFPKTFRICYEPHKVDGNESEQIKTSRLQQYNNG